MNKFKVFDPFQDELSKLYNRVYNIESRMGELGTQILKLGDFVNRSNLSNVVLAYLFAHGITAFQFVRVISLTPKDVIVFMNTDKGYIVVDIHEENEMMKITHHTVDYDTFSQLIHDYLVLLREISIPQVVKEIEQDIKRWEKSS